jgi:hypothetical protein
MNNVFKNVVKASVVAVVAASASVVAQTQSAQAFTIASGSVLSVNSGSGGLQLPGTNVDTLVDFYGASGPNGSANGTGIVTSNASSGSFASLTGNSVSVSDLTEGSFSSIAQGFGAQFLQISNGAPGPVGDIFFFLTGFPPGGVDFVYGGRNTLGVFAEFAGQFLNADGAILGEGLATATLTAGSTALSGPWNLSIVATNPDTTTPVPTPALLPGIFALGATAIRKRKQQAAAV